MPKSVKHAFPENAILQYYCVSFMLQNRYKEGLNAYSYVILNFVVSFCIYLSVFKLGNLFLESLCTKIKLAKNSARQYLTYIKLC